MLELGVPLPSGHPKLPRGNGASAPLLDGGRRGEWVDSLRQARWLSQAEGGPQGGMHGWGTPTTASLRTPKGGSTRASRTAQGWWGGDWEQSSAVKEGASQTP